MSVDKVKNTSQDTAWNPVCWSLMCQVRRWSLHTKPHSAKSENAHPGAGNRTDRTCGGRRLPICHKSRRGYLLGCFPEKYETAFPACGSSNSAIELTIPEMEKYSGYKEWIDVCKPR